MDRRVELERLAHDARAFLEPHWIVWHRKAGSPSGRRTLSEGTCGRSSRFLHELLQTQGFEAEMVFGSPVECACGFRTAEGWKGHGWVVVKDPACIVDLTADQFGADPVIVTTPDDPRYKAGHDMADVDWIAERERVARELIQDWNARSLASASESASGGTEL